METHGAVSKDFTLIWVQSDSFPALGHRLCDGAGPARTFILTLVLRDHALQQIQPVVSVTEVVEIGMLLTAAGAAVVLSLET